MEVGCLQEVVAMIELTVMYTFHADMIKSTIFAIMIEALKFL